MVFGLVHGTSEALYSIVSVIDVVLLAAAALVFYKTLHRLVSPASAMVGGAAYLGGALLGFNLMESAMALVTTSSLFAYGWHCRAEEDFRPARGLSFGLILGTCMLARLDAVFIALTIGLVDITHIFLDQTLRRERLLHLLAIIAGASVLVLPLFLFNQLTSGSIVPISGRIESPFPYVHLAPIAVMLQTLGPLRILITLAGMAYLFFYVRWRPSRAAYADKRQRFLLDCTAMLAAVCLIQLVNEVFFMRWPLYWHFWALVPLGALLSAIVCQRALDFFAVPAKSSVVIGLILVVALPFGWAIQRRMRPELHNDWRVGAYKAALWVRHHIAPDTRLAMRVAEITGFFAERQIVDLLGVCSNLALQQAIKEQRLFDYLKQSKVQYIVQMNFPDGVEGLATDLPASGAKQSSVGMVRFSSDLYETMSDPIPLAEEVFRDGPYFGQGKQRWITVFRVAVEEDKRLRP